jgi:hypothetical protein
VQFVGGAGSAFGESLESFEPTAGIFRTGLEPFCGSAGLLDVFRPGAGSEFREQLPQPLQFGRGSLPLDFQQAAQQFSDWLFSLHVLPDEHRKAYHATIHRAADVADADRVDGAHERLSGGKLPPLNASDPHGHCQHGIRRPREGRRSQEEEKAKKRGSEAESPVPPGTPSPSAQALNSPGCHAHGYTRPEFFCLFLRYFSRCLTLPTGSANFPRSASRCH